MNKIKHYRMMAGYTQQELSDIMQVGKMTLIRWENGQSNPDYMQALKLARVLKVELTNMFSEPKEDPHLNDVRQEISQWKRYIMTVMPPIIDKEVLEVDPDFDLWGIDNTTLEGLAKLPQTGAVKAQIGYIEYISKLFSELPPEPESVTSIREREIKEALEWMERTWVKPTDK